MSEWKRPTDFEERAEVAARDMSEAGDVDDIEEAFLSGALWAALMAEGRLDE